MVKKYQLKFLLVTMLVISTASCENSDESAYYIRSESAKTNDAAYMRMQHYFDNLSEKEKNLLEEIVMERFIDKQEYESYQGEPDTYDGW